MNLSNNVGEIKGCVEDIRVSPANYNLLDGQFIKDLNINIPEGSYLHHFTAGTGCGKSTWAIEDFAKNRFVIFLVPQVAQAKQMENHYQSRHDMQFFYAGHHSGVPYKRIQVAVYDQLPYIMKHINPSKYVLIIDEVHKLYQAANYRDKAITFLYDTVINKCFKQVITLSATVTPELLPFEYARWTVIEKRDPVQRQFEICLYDEVIDRDSAVSQLLPSEKGKCLVVRVNSKKQQARLQKQYENQGLKCLVVNRDVQGEEVVQGMLESGMIPEDVDVLLTTILLDEAVNINNTNIDSVHVVGGGMHTEEQEQFIGRFRKQNPKVFMHLSCGEVSKPFTDLEARKEGLLRIANSMLTIFHTVREMGSDMTVKSLNLVFKNQKHNVKFLREVSDDSGKSGQAVINHTAIAAELYRYSMLNQYVSGEALVEAIKAQFKGNVDVCVNMIDEFALPDYSIMLAEIDKLLDEERLQFIEDCLSVAEELAEKDEHSSDEHKSFEEHLVNNVAYLSSQHSSNTLKGSIYNTWAMLNKFVLQDPYESLDAMCLRRADALWNFWDTFHSDVVIRPVLLHLRKVDAGTRISKDEAEELFKEIYRAESKKDLTFKEIVQGGKLSGVKVKKNNHFHVTQRFVCKVFRYYTNSVLERDWIDFNGLEPFGYRFKLDALGFKYRKRKLSQETCLEQHDVSTNAADELALNNDLDWLENL